MGDALGPLAILALVPANGFFVATEFATGGRCITWATPKAGPAVLDAPEASVANSNRTE